MRSHLKVKVFTLSAEMTYIHRQEIKWKKRAKFAREKFGNATKAEIQFWSHRDHRYGLKTDARICHLAYGFMKGLSYAQMENICYGHLKGYGSSEPDWKAIEITIERFTRDENPQATMQRFAEWLADAQKWYEGNPERIKQLDAERPARIEALKAAKVPYKKPQRVSM